MAERQLAGCCFFFSFFSHSPCLPCTLTKLLPLFFPFLLLSFLLLSFSSSYKRKWGGEQTIGLISSFFLFYPFSIQHPLDFNAQSEDLSLSGCSAAVLTGQQELADGVTSWTLDSSDIFKWTEQKNRRNCHNQVAVNTWWVSSWRSRWTRRNQAGLEALLTSGWWKKKLLFCCCIMIDKLLG